MRAEKQLVVDNSVGIRGLVKNKGLKKAEMVGVKMAVCKQWLTQNVFYRHGVLVVISHPCGVPNALLCSSASNED